MHQAGGSAQSGVEVMFGKVGVFVVQAKSYALCDLTDLKRMSESIPEEIGLMPWK
jgi:hypothetical protein